MRHLPVRRQIEEVVSSLESYGMFTFRDTLIRVERVRVNRALELYRRTLESVASRTELEPLASTWCEKAQVSWTSHPADIGYKVRQRHIARIRPQTAHAVEAWAKAGFPFAGGGGVYNTVPNKSYERVVALAKHPELRDAVLHYGDLEGWYTFWDTYLNLRHQASVYLLDALKNRDPEALSRGNESAGLGLKIRGHLPTRGETHQYRRDLDFLINYQWDRCIAFAASQIAKLDAEDVYLIQVEDPTIRGSIASRSDVDVKDVSWDGSQLIIDAEAGTRQVGGDGTGILSNSKSEKKYFGASVTEQVLRTLALPNVSYPNTNREMLLEAWATGVNPKTPPYIIGEDIGLTGLLKAGADNLFSRAFLQIGRRVLPEMLSGSSYTQAVYWYFHKQFSQRVRGRLMCMGDDVNLITTEDTEEVFQPYTKVKSTKPETNDKKVLGWWVRTAPGRTTFAVVPRIVKSLSSAAKRSGEWEKLLSGQGPTGSLELALPERINNEMQLGLQDIMPYMFWSGEPREFLPMLHELWSGNDSSFWEKLAKLKDDVEHRFGQQDEAVDQGVVM